MLCGVLYLFERPCRDDIESRLDVKKLSYLIPTNFDELFAEIVDRVCVRRFLNRVNRILESFVLRLR